MVTGFIFLILLGALAFNFSGYIFGLSIMRFFKPREIRRGAEINEIDLPPVAIVVPVFNEAAFIGKKIDNLFTLKYPTAKRVVYLCDSGSTDRTKDIIKEKQLFYGKENIVLVECERRGKIHQLNKVLSLLSPDTLVVITDADTLLKTTQCLIKAMDCFLSSPDVGLVGGWTTPSPSTACGAEVAYWDKLNRERHLESRTYSSTLVVAPFYAFFRRDFASFPEDCVADDVHISMKMNVEDRRVLYVDDIEVVELRQPTNLREVFLHKLRKANAYSIELFRFLYLLPHLGIRYKFFFLFKIYQFFLLPWLSILFGCEVVELLLQGRYLIVGAGLLFLGSVILMGSLLLTPPKTKMRGGFRLVSILHTLQLFPLLNAVLITNSLFFPFWVQSSSYQRLSPLSSRREDSPSESPFTAAREAA